jgi:hypothetical protein
MSSESDEVGRRTPAEAGLLADLRAMSNGELTRRLIEDLSNQQAYIDEIAERRSTGRWEFGNDGLDPSVASPIPQPPELAAALREFNGGFDT